jgi:hypothetical protein
MRNFLNAIKELPHPEERPRACPWLELGARLEGRTIVMQPRIFHTLGEVAFDPLRHPLYSGNPWLLPVVGGYYRLRDRLDRLLA